MIWLGREKKSKTVKEWKFSVGETVLKRYFVYGSSNKKFFDLILQIGCSETRTGGNSPWHGGPNRRGRRKNPQNEWGV